VAITPRSGVDTDPDEPMELLGPVSWRVTIWIVGGFAIGAYLTHLIVVGALYAAERFLR
jgi:hypothetical protein